MKIQIRKHVFETNSSSVHSLCVCTKEEYNAWRRGELLYNDHKEEMTDICFPEDGEKTYEEYRDFIDNTLSSWPKEELYKEFKGKDGTEYVVFGYCGEWH